VRVDVERGLILVRSAVPGAADSWVEVRDAVKGVGVEGLAYPGKFRTGDEHKPVDSPEPGSDEAEMVAEGAPVANAPAADAAGEEDAKS